jgi:formylglycine-generating enzyme required for sulfatase activity
MVEADCCESVALPGGTFEMGAYIPGVTVCPPALAETCEQDEFPRHAVTLSPYSLDRFEVTVARFRNFVDAWDYRGLPAGAGGDAQVAKAGWNAEWNQYLPSSKSELEASLFCDDGHGSNWTTAPGSNETQPIDCLTWYQAFAFCVWDGGRLPTEAEWEFAAANGTDGTVYPWGDASPTWELAAYHCIGDVAPCAVDLLVPIPVGTLPLGENRWGHRDLAGNVEEWTRDTWAPYPSMPTTNYADVTEGFRVLRGGSFRSTSTALTSTGRDFDQPGMADITFGVRCARSQ